jgi:hypothetical protein
MAIKNLESLYDLIGDGPVNNMEAQTGPAFPIIGPGVERGINPGIPAGSQLHGGPLTNQAGRSLIGPNFAYNYGGVAIPSQLDLNGNPPPLQSPFGPQYANGGGPDEGFY